MSRKFTNYIDSNEDATSPYGHEKRVYSISDINTSYSDVLDNNYFDATSISMNIFDNILKSISNIENMQLRNNLSEFVNVFISILNELKGISNNLPAFVLTVENDSVFLEWVFKDFRIGFTILENESDSMWFMITNKNLEELSISGDLTSSNYTKVIIKILDYVLVNS